MVRGIRAFVLRDLVDEGPALPQRPWLGRVVPRLLEARHTVRRRGRCGCDATGSTSWIGNGKVFLGRLASAVHVQDERAFITRLSSWRGQRRGSGATRLAPRGPGQACCSRSLKPKTLACGYSHGGPAMLRPLLILSVLTGAWCGTLRGQVTSDASASNTRGLCLRPQPAPSCRAFTLTEFSVNSAEFGDQNGSAGHLQWDVGAMVNFGRVHAVGASLSFGEPDVGHWGGTVRYRRWINEAAALELSPGFVVAGSLPQNHQVRLTADVSLVGGGWVGMFVHGEAAGQGRLGAGGRLTSWLGL